jgi:hypothetical protein
MKTFIAAIALVAALASPAFAQSYDPDLGTGNIAQFQAPASQSAAQSALAQVRPGAPAGHRGARVTSPYSAYNAVTPFGSPTNAKNAARDTAVRECSVLAAPYKEMTWGTMQIQQYRSCMAQYGHAE